MLPILINFYITNLHHSLLFDIKSIQITYKKGQEQHEFHLLSVCHPKQL